MIYIRLDAVILKWFNQHYKRGKSWAEPSCQDGVVVARDLPARLFSKGPLEPIVLTNQHIHTWYAYINRL